MSFRATTTATILRGEGTDSFGDPIDLDAVVASGIPVSILEQRSTPRRPVEGRTDNVRAYVLRAHRPVELRRDDRVRDERTTTVYTIDEVVIPVNTVGHGGVRAVLRRVT